MCMYCNWTTYRKRKQDYIDDSEIDVEDELVDLVEDK
eukprot:CAMPEP_0202703330 /NCGR_PEP_ID=MMETSP1385-20130828/16189_1 /ASSEMBLY_ACC=CAM_ASM_000861 /TAXON_ID=933848 /ORGANISM="Elphidium margaritaceum" /LENGTH=36 /DNA_ID= /DNA_START= /DNA_END= /DNA_ORIENTATION=